MGMSLSEEKTFVEASRNNSANNVPGSYVFAVKKGPLNSVKEKEMQPGLVLDDSCYLDRDFSLSLMGKVKEFSSLSNLKLVLATEGFNNVNIKYMVGSWFSSLQQVSDSFHVDERVAWIDIEGIRAKEVNGWNPDFMEEEDTQTESDKAPIRSESDVDEIPKTVFENGKDFSNEVHSQNKGVVEASSEDPFHIYDLLNKKHENDIGNVRSQTGDTLKYPQEDVESNKATQIPKEAGEVFACSGHFQKAMTLRSQGSFLQFMKDLVKVGHTVGTLVDIDKTIDVGNANSDLLNNRMNVMNSLLDLDKLKSLEVAQKAKIKWSIEGYENSKYFHELERVVWDCGLDKSLWPNGFTFGFYRRYWSFLENDVMEAVSYFFQHGSFVKGGNSSFISLIPKTQNANMVKDFRPISLIGSLYKIIAKILANHLVVVLGDIVSDVQSAFVADRQILDAPLVLNDLIQWCKSNKKQTMIFKVDFEKVFDSVRWDYLDDVLKKFGFGNRWCAWIQSCLRLSRGSILVNGSPTKEFQFHKGHKQGDPLSPFLFILIMESLYLSFQNVVNAGMFKGVSIGSNLHLSHLFYADDVGFLGQWSDSNISIIINVLKCFFCASGLCINMHKSKLMGIAIDDDTVNQAARLIGCLQLKPPLSYLGSKIGGLMSRINSWDDIVNKLLARLSKWKMKTLSIGGRLTLLKSVLGSTPIYYMSLFKVPSQVLKRMESIRSCFFNGVDVKEKNVSLVNWNKVMASKDRGGLGVSSFYAMNRALMFKRVWRFKTDTTSLWVRFINAMHGKDGHLDKKVKSPFPFIWLDIVRELDNLKNQAFKFLYPRIYKLETCKQINVATKLVHDNVRLTLRRLPRGRAELEQFNDLINSLVDLQLPNMQDRWFSSLSGSGDFSVASVRQFIDDHLLPEVSSKFCWRKIVPIKVNILAWKVKLDVLPTRFNLSKRGLDINFILCPICEKYAGSSSHLFFACSMVRDIYRKIASWWDVNSPRVYSFEEWEVWMSSLVLSSKRKQLLEGVTYIAWWLIWNFRNKLVFGSTIPSKVVLFDDIVAHSFQWGGRHVGPSRSVDDGISEVAGKRVGACRGVWVLSVWKFC
ncbi:RNA-directed DNA polymerase, eukaryota [Tanacetum coccineum]